MTSVTVCSGTPEIAVLDNRGLHVRQLRYQRSDVKNVARQRLSRDGFDELGRLTTRQDARFYAESSATLNFQYDGSLAGQVLRTRSVDGGESLIFHDIEGRPIWQRDARGTVQTYTYDALGRPLSRSEQLEGKGQNCVRERWIYDQIESGTSTAQDRNLRGRLSRHYDTAGLIDYSAIGYTLQGPAQQAQRRLLPPELASDWAGTAQADWQAPLEAVAYAHTTAWQYNALGQLMTQADAAGHRQRYAYDVAGRRQASWVKPVVGEEQQVVVSLTYNAAGQIQSKQNAKGVTQESLYQVQTRRLLEIKTTRVGGDGAVLQYLKYTYDPVGNVTMVTDQASQTLYFGNQAVTADRTYEYDALYQLIGATGRENAVGAPSGTDSPEAFAPPDPFNYRTYKRTYDYDPGGNLLQIGSQAAGAGTATRTILVASDSNRAVGAANLSNVSAEQVGTYCFDAAGNANCLDGNSNKPLGWNGLNQLQHAVLLKRSDSDLLQNDRESYAYDGDRRRVRKTGYKQVGGRMSQQNDVIYLPGLELRADTATGEMLQVVELEDGIRMLYWTAGGPGGNAQPALRFSIDDRLGSCQLEVDSQGQIISQEEYYPYGGTAVRAARSAGEADYKTIRYSGKERDTTGLYYYGYRYYQPWIGRWLGTDPAGTVDGLNLYRMVRNNPVSLRDSDGLAPAETGKYQINMNPLRPAGLMNRGKLELAVNKTNVVVLHEGNYSKDTGFEMVKVNSLSNPDCLIDTEHLLNVVRKYHDGYEKLSRDQEIRNHKISGNVDLGNEVSGYLLKMLESFESDRRERDMWEDPAMSDARREQFARLGQQDRADEMKGPSSEKHFFALTKKREGNALGTEREIYGVFAGTSLPDELVINYVVIHPNVMVHEVQRAEGRPKIDDKYKIKGAGAFMTVNSIKQLTKTKELSIKKIGTEAINPRSAAIAQKFGAKKVGA